MTTFAHSSRSKTNNSNIDLTPMLDVVFILLIFFVVTATFLKESTLSINSLDNSSNQPVSQINENILI